MRWFWFAPLALMALYVAYMGLRQGLAVADLTETEAIATFARYYTMEVPRGRAADCSARPGSDRVWLVIDCAPVPYDAERHRRYLVGRDGRAIARPEGI